MIKGIKEKMENLPKIYDLIIICTIVREKLIYTYIFANCFKNICIIVYIIIIAIIYFKSITFSPRNYLISLSLTSYCLIIYRLVVIIDLKRISYLYR